MPPSDPDDDLPVLLDDLEDTLSALRAELRADESGQTTDAGRAETPTTDGERGETAPSGARAPSRRRRDSERLRPPSLSELFRFTEQYTLPTLISLLEATIRSLELLRGVLRLADPERSAFDRGAERREFGRPASPATRLGDGVAGVGREAAAGVERALSELQTALSETDLPDDRDSRELLDDARRLSEEVSDRLADARRESDAERYGYRRDEQPSASAGSERERRGAPDEVEIAVDDGRGGDGGETGSDDRRGSDAAETDTAEVDIEGELASIKDEVDRRDGSADRPDRRDAPDEDDDRGSDTGGDRDAADASDDGIEG